MRNLLTVCAALVVVLGFVSGNLWYDLRSAREQVVDLQGELEQANAALARAAQVPVPSPPAIQAPAAPAVAAQPPQPLPPPPAMPRTPPPPAPVVSASASRPLIGNTEQERRADALLQSDRTAMARVQAWSTALSLSPEQLEALHATTKAELQRETEESLQIDSTNGPMDARTAARIKVETVTRQHETLVRIHEKMVPQLTPGQSTRMRTMFDSWLASNMARAKAEEQAVMMSGN